MQNLGLGHQEHLVARSNNHLGKSFHFVFGLRCEERRRKTANLVKRCDTLVRQRVGQSGLEVALHSVDDRVYHVAKVFILGQDELN